MAAPLDQRGRARSRSQDLNIGPVDVDGKPRRVDSFDLTQAAVHNVLLKNLPAKKDTVWVDKNETVDHVLGILRKHKIVSVPVVDKALPTGDPNYVLGLVSIADISRAFCFQKIFNTYDTDAKVEEVTDEVWQGAQNKDILRAPVEALLGETEESSQLFVFEGTDPLTSVIETFSCGVHRVLVRVRGAPGKDTDTESKADNSAELRIISQTDVAKYMLGHRAEPGFAHIWDRTVSQLRVGSLYSVVSMGSMDQIAVDKLHAKERKHITSVSEKSTAITAFRAMDLGHRMVHSLPVVDDKGVLVDTISETDLRGLDVNSLQLVLERIPEYLKQVRPGHRVAITCKKSDTLASVAQKILQARVHRAWLVNDAMHPIGCVSLTDICTAFTYI